MRRAGPQASSWRPAKSTGAPVCCANFIYVRRSQVERLWDRLKEWRTVATRYEKTTRAFLGALYVAATQD